MRVVRYRDAAAFLDAAGPWLSRAEVENNVILGIAGAIGGGILAPKEPAWFAAAVDGDNICCCAARTPPQALLLTSGSARALAALAADAHACFPELRGVNGPRAAAAHFAAAWTALAGGSASIGKQLRLYRIDRVDAGTPQARGRLRQATRQEQAMAVQWATAFAAEAMPNDPSDPEASVDRYLKTGGLYVWDHGGPVALCARTEVGGGTPGRDDTQTPEPRSAKASRISFVYTPREFRRRGYATAAVAELTRRLLASGAPYCCLYTDLANPTSNGIYARIGYRPVCDFDEYAFRK